MVNTSQAHDHPPGQLTRFSVGSMRELWSLSYPLMLSLFSVGIMILCDRLFLASLSAEAFNGVSEAAMVFMTFEFSIVTLAAVAEVLVGRAYGARLFNQVSRPVWAMIWMGLATVVIFYPIAIWGADFLFYGSPYAEVAKDFFCTLCFFGPILPVNAALSSFWIGRGRVVFVTLLVSLCSCLNIGLDYLFIYGGDFWFGAIPSLGVFGAALGTGIAQLVLALLLFTAFFRRKYQIKYNSHRCSFDFSIWKQAFTLGFPQALAMLIQCAAWSFFFRIMSISSEQHALVCGIAQAVFFFFNFVIEGMSKATTTVVSNLIGAKRYAEIGAVVRAGLQLLFLFAMGVCGMIFIAPDWFLHWFLPPDIQYNVEVVTSLHASLFWIWLTLMGEALLFLFSGVLLAFGDTRFILLTSSVCVWLFAVLPTAIVILMFHQGPESAFAVVSLYYAVAGTFYWLRIHRRLAIHVIPAGYELK